MNTFTKALSLILLTGFLMGCGSMRPPSTDPYFAGYHARDAQEVEKEYEQWTEKQERLNEQARIQDSLRQKFYSSGNAPLNYYNYNFYRWSPHRWSYYQPYSYGSSWSFRYSTHPWFVNTWWYDDYLWDSYFWRSRYYSPYYYSPYSPYYSSHGYGYSPYYWYGDYSGGSDYYVVPEQDPRVQRPNDRDPFTRSRFQPSTGATSSSIQQTSGSNSDASSSSSTSTQVSRTRSRITPAVVDREAIMETGNPDYLIEEVKERTPVYRGSRYTQDSDDDSESGSSDSYRSSRTRTSSSGSYRSPSRSSGSSSSSGSATRSSSSSSSSGSSSSGSNTKQSRPKDRRR